MLYLLQLHLPTCLIHTQVCVGVALRVCCTVICESLKLCYQQMRKSSQLKNAQKLCTPVCVLVCVCVRVSV